MFAISKHGHLKWHYMSSLATICVTCQRVVTVTVTTSVRKSALKDHRWEEEEEGGWEWEGEEEWEVELVEEVMAKEVRRSLSWSYHQPWADSARGWTLCPASHVDTFLFCNFLFQFTVLWAYFYSIQCKNICCAYVALTCLVKNKK